MVANSLFFICYIFNGFNYKTHNLFKCCLENATFSEEIPTCSFFIFISMVFKEFGGVRLFPFSEYVAFC